MTMQSYADSGMAASLWDRLVGPISGTGSPPVQAVRDPPIAPSAALNDSGSGIGRPAA